MLAFFLPLLYTIITEIKGGIVIMLLSEKFKKQIAAAELMNAYPCGVEREAAEVVYKKAKKTFEKELFKMIKDTYKNTMPQQQIKAFYIACFNDEKGGQELKAVTFGELLQALKNGIEFYSYSGACDSIVRERLFILLANILDKKYSYIYDLWLHKGRV